MPNFKLFKKHYTTPGNEIAFSGLYQIYKYYDKKISIHDIEKKLEHINSYSLHKKTRNKRVTNPFFIYKRRIMFMIDLVDVQTMSEKNDNTKYLLTCIDCFSRYAWVRTCINKSAESVFTQFKSIMDELDEKPLKVHSDKGLEIKNKLFNKYCTKNNIKQIYSENVQKSAFVERFNQSLQSLIYNYLTYNNTKRYIDALQSLVSSYNNRWHRSILTSPNIADDKNNHNQVFQHLRFKHFELITQFKKVKPKYRIGDNVRLKNYEKLFKRGYAQQFTEEIFLIRTVHTRMPITTYSIEDLNGELVDGSFYENEITKVLKDDNREFKIDEVLKTKGKGKNKQHFVSWMGYGPKFNSWIKANDVKSI